MNFFTRISRELSDPLKTFRVFERLIAVFCIAIPALLRLADPGYPGFRVSISDYVYMSDSYIYGMLLCMAAMLFIFNGAVYFRNADRFGLRQEGTWYNVILGVSLLGVILFPHRQYVLIHYFFGGVFFLGNAVVIGVFHAPKDRVLSIVLAVITVTAIAVHYIFGLISLLTGEWISLVVIALHFIMQSRVTRADAGKSPAMLPALLFPALLLLGLAGCKDRKDPIDEVAALYSKSMWTVCYGDQDKAAPYEQAPLLRDTLNRLGVKNYLFTVKGKKHGNFSPEEMTEIYQQLWPFLDGIGIGSVGDRGWGLPAIAKIAESSSEPARKR